jgi:transcription elongation factor Elf1
MQRRGLIRRNLRAAAGTVTAYARCPGCGRHYEAGELRLRSGNTRGLAVCKVCHLIDGPDGKMEEIG